jgi:dCTP deaminase
MMLASTALRERLSGVREHRVLGGLLGWDERLPEWQRLVVDPLRPNAVQPCSIDVHLGRSLLVYEGPRTDTRRDNSPWWRALPLTRVVDEYRERSIGSVVDESLGWVLRPGSFYLGVLDEYVGVPEDCCGQLGGVSSRARDGVMVHQQAGLLDPGWHGKATLEITVAAPHTILYPGQRIGQVTFTRLDGRASPIYRGRYQNDCAPQPARLGELIA